MIDVSILSSTEICASAVRICGVGSQLGAKNLFHGPAIKYANMRSFTFVALVYTIGSESSGSSGHDVYPHIGLYILGFIVINKVICC